MDDQRPQIDPKFILMPKIEGVVDDIEEILGCKVYIDKTTSDPDFWMAVCDYKKP